MTQPDWNDVTAFVHKLADNSGDIIRKYFRNLDQIDTKTDASPVTVADREVEEAIRASIRANYPDHGIHGEEFGVENANARYVWVIDPIDGTLSFMIGRPSFLTMIALLENGVPVLSCLNQPVTRERWLAAKGQGATLNGKNIRTRTCKTLSDAVLGCTSTEYYLSKQLQAYEALNAKIKHRVYGGDAYLYALVAGGTLDIAVDAGLKPHDFLPIIPLIEEAGGIITDWQGKPLTPASKGDVVMAGDAHIHAMAVEVLGG